MNQEMINLAQEAGFDDEVIVPWSFEFARFAALVAQRERDELVVMFLEAHEGAKTAHNYWAVAANKIKERNV